MNPSLEDTISFSLLSQDKSVSS